MVREAVLTVDIEGCTAQELHSLIYVEDRELRQYHKDANKDDNIDITPWVDNTRIVTYKMPLAAGYIPAWLLNSLVGGDSVQVKESQESKSDDTGNFIILCNPLIDIVGGSQFISSCTYTISDTPKGSCQMKAAISCTMGGEPGPAKAGWGSWAMGWASWGTAATVEGYMIDQAKITVAGYLDFCIKAGRAAHADKPAQRSSLKQMLAPLHMKGVTLIAQTSMKLRQLSAGKITLPAAEDGGSALADIQECESPLAANPTPIEGATDTIGTIKASSAVQVTAHAE